MQFMPCPVSRRQTVTVRHKNNGLQRSPLFYSVILFIVIQPTDYSPNSSFTSSGVERPDIS